MRILHISAHAGGGAGKAILGLALECSKSDELEQRILLLEKPEKPLKINFDADSNIKILYAENDTNLIYNSIEWADVIVISWWNHPAMSQFMSRFMNKKCRFVLWSHINGCSYPFLAYSLADMSERLLVTTKYSLENPIWTDAQKKHLKSKTNLVSGIGNFKPNEVKAKANYEIKEKFVIGYAGTINFAKMHPEYFEYCKSVKECIPEAEFILIGDADDTSKNEVIKHGLQDCVTFTGYVEDIYNYYNKMDVMGYLLNEENYATTENAILEAMASGIPVVVFNNGPERNIIKNNITGIIINNKQEYTDKILMLKNDINLRRSIGENGRKYILENYSAEKNSSYFLDIIKDVMNSDKKIYDFSKAIGNKPYDWFCSSTGNNSDSFYSLKNKSDEEINSFLSKLPDVYKVKTKSSIYHFEKYFPYDSELKNLVKRLDNMKKFEKSNCIKNK